MTAEDTIKLYGIHCYFCGASGYIPRPIKPNEKFVCPSCYATEEVQKEIAKEYPDFGKGVGYKMSMTDGLEKEN